MYPLQDVIHPHGEFEANSSHSCKSAPPCSAGTVAHLPALLWNSVISHVVQEAPLMLMCLLAALADRLYASAGVRFAGPISILRNWSFCLFYVMAELWGSVVVSLLFWGFANQVSPAGSGRLMLCRNRTIFAAACLILLGVSSGSGGGLPAGR